MGNNLLFRSLSARFATAALFHSQKAQYKNLWLILTFSDKILPH